MVDGGEGISSSLNIPMTVPPLGAILEDLHYCGANIVFGIQPRQRLIGMEGSLPMEISILVKLHAEQGIRQRGEVVVVDAGIDESRRKADLFL